MLGNLIEPPERFVLIQFRRVKRERESPDQDVSFSWQGSIDFRPGLFFSPKWQW